MILKIHNEKKEKKRIKDIQKNRDQTKLSNLKDVKKLNNFLKSPKYKYYLLVVIY